MSSTDTNQGSHWHIFRRGIDNDGGYNVCECGFKKYDTNQASELFELCREVYRLTYWRVPISERPVEYWVQHDGEWDLEYGTIGMPVDGDVVPLYTSDDLLEKLPNELKRSDDQYGALWGMKNLTQMLDGVWDASYRFEDEMNPPDYKYSCESDTPLKALLKLTIALSEAGELNG